MSVIVLGQRKGQHLNWLYHLLNGNPCTDSCNERYVYYQTVIDKLIEICFPS